MITKLYLGFEMDLYEPWEFHMIYWYIDYLYGLRVYNLNELYLAIEQSGGGAKKKPPPRKDQASARNPQRPRNPPAHLVLLEGQLQTVRGLFRLLTYCHRANLISAPSEGAKNSLSQRFVLRFR